MAKILVLDDEPNNRYLIAALFGHGGDVVFEAADGAEGLRIAKEQRPDVIIMDLAMPGMHGASFIKALRCDADLAGTALVLYTATVPNAAMRDFMELHGIEDVIPKPAEPEAILRTVSAVLAARRRRAHKNPTPRPERASASPAIFVRS
jgi:CheY-like chemotaxis protein